jgi:hypothetical protein
MSVSSSTKTSRKNPKPNPNTTTSASAGVASTATKTMDLLVQLHALIPFDDPSPTELLAARSTTRVATEALTVASSVLATSPARFPDIDASVIREAVAFEQSFGPIALELEQLHQRVVKTVLHRRAQGVLQTLALYQSLKVIARVSPNKATAVAQQKLAKLLKTSKKTRATTVTQGELQVAKKSIKATKTAKAKADAAATATAEAEHAAKLEELVLGTSADTSSEAPAPAAAAAPAAPVAPAGTHGS